MGYEPGAVEEEEGNDDVAYARGLGSLEVAVEAEVPIGHVGD